jgi:hypothetical protein
MSHVDLADLRIPADLRERAGEILTITDRVSLEHPDAEYARLCRHLVGRLAFPPVGPVLGSISPARREFVTELRRSASL